MTDIIVLIVRLFVIGLLVFEASNDKKMGSHISAAILLATAAILLFI